MTSDFSVGNPGYGPGCTELVVTMVDGFRRVELESGSNGGFWSDNGPFQFLVSLHPPSDGRGASLQFTALAQGELAR